MDEKKVQNNNRKANLIANLAEIVIVILYLIFGFKSISEGISDMDFGGMFDDVMGVIWFLNIAILALALICLTYSKHLYSSDDNPGNRQFHACPELLCGN